MNLGSTVSLISFIDERTLLITGHTSDGINLSNLTITSMKGSRNLGSMMTIAFTTKAGPRKYRRNRPYILITDSFIGESSKYSKT